MVIRAIRGGNPAKRTVTEIAGGLAPVTAIAIEIAIIGDVAAAVRRTVAVAVGAVIVTVIGIVTIGVEAPAIGIVTVDVIGTIGIVTEVVPVGHPRVVPWIGVPRVGTRSRGMIIRILRSPKMLSNR